MQNEECQCGPYALVCRVGKYPPVLAEGRHIRKV